MADERITNPPAPNHREHDDFEREDLQPSGPLYFMVGLAVFGVVIYLAMYGLYNFLERSEKARQAPLSPMATPQADTRTVTHEGIQTFPQPRLEENERTQLGPFIEEQERRLATYDWVNKEQGTVRIPIERAMELIVQRGLPVRPESSNAAPTSPARKQTPKAPATKAAASGN
jgi:hypothetical protein